MKKKTKILLIFIWIALNLCMLAMVWSYTPESVRQIKLEVTLSADTTNDYQVFYTTDNSITDTSFSADDSVIANLDVEDQNQTLEFEIPSNTTYIRLDCGNQESEFCIDKVQLTYDENSILISQDDLMDVAEYNSITSYFQDENGVIKGMTTEDDPYLVWNISGYDTQVLIKDVVRADSLWLYIILTICMIAIDFVVFKFRHKLFEVIKDLFDNRKLIMNLARTDFKTKYSASYLGVFWAFVQPIVTIAIYVFVFQVGFKAGDTSTGYPFLLYLVAGIIPWFFFAESWMNATNCLVEYSYLVKKVVFRISILPIVKIISALFVHLFFIALALFLFVINGRIPGVTYIQIVYYLFCTICFALALSYFTAAITPFFQDISQIINILTQVGMWTIPIMYDESIMSSKIMSVLKLNPMYYVVTGYRDAYMHGQWFWNRARLTIYFWSAVCILFFIGFKTFKKLKVHFADVL